MPTGREMLELARQHIGQPYDNVLVPKNNPNWKGPWDCAEFMSWLVFQVGGFLYGCLEINAKPDSADAYTGAWRDDSNRLGRRIPYERAAAIVGGVVLRYPPRPGRMGHIVICDGKGGTVEAMGREFGITTHTVHMRRWNTGVLVPGIHYDEDVTEIDVVKPPLIYHINAPNVDRSVVRDIQRALNSAGIDSGPVDGIFGPKTMAAVGAFQQLKGLVVDGEVGPITAQALDVNI
jgi:N-acetylmuramoyl-L-alanine amidase